jgi:hypothetical protein
MIEAVGDPDVQTLLPRNMAYTHPCVKSDERVILLAYFIIG